MNNTIQITNQVLARTSWTFAQAEVAVHQLLDNLGESTRDNARHDLDTAAYVIDEALVQWDRTAI